ncbi:unnamed protein product [Ixodes pacificus]
MMATTERECTLAESNFFRPKNGKPRLVTTSCQLVLFQSNFSHLYTLPFQCGRFHDASKPVALAPHTHTSTKTASALASAPPAAAPASSRPRSFVGPHSSSCAPTARPPWPLPSVSPPRGSLRWPPLFSSPLPTVSSPGPGTWFRPLPCSSPRCTSSASRPAAASPRSPGVLRPLLSASRLPVSVWC